MLEAAAKRGEVRQGSLPPVQERQEDLCELAFLVRRHGEGAQEGVDHEASVDDALRRQLALVVAKAKPQAGSQPVPVPLRGSRAPS